MRLSTTLMNCSRSSAEAKIGTCFIRSALMVTTFSLREVCLHVTRTRIVKSSDCSTSLRPIRTFVIGLRRPDDVIDMRGKKDHNNPIDLKCVDCVEDEVPCKTKR